MGAGIGQDARLAELVGGLSLATDRAAGLPDETALRTSLVATGIARALGVTGAPLGDVYWASLLRFVGCTAYAHETAWQWGVGEDQAFLGALAPVDGTSVAQVVRAAVAAQPKGAGTRRRAAAVARLLSDPRGPRKLARAHCDLAVALAGKLGMPDAVQVVLAQMYERWDGKGHPHGLRGDAIGLPARVLHVAWEMVVHVKLAGASGALAVVRERRGRTFDPRVVDAFVAHAGELLPPVAGASAWAAFLAAEPSPARRTGTSAVAVAEAFATYADVKSPFTLGHSPRVARLADAAAGELGMPAAEREKLEVAALLHDLGRVAVPNGIWDKPGALDAAEWQRVRQHAYETERILAASPLLVEHARLASMDHERDDGSGYPRGLAGGGLGRAARVLAAADAFVAMREARAHRRAMTDEAAAKTLVLEARRGALDRVAVDAVLAASGQSVERARGEARAGLSEREREVLVLLARGLSNKEIASELGISPKTAQHHVAHIYEKTGVSSRAAAATYAAVNGIA